MRTTPAGARGVTDPVVVETPSGTLAGTVVDTEHGPVERFAGVPFGEAPVGGGRFRAARPAAPWAGIRAADTFGPSPLQAVGGAFANAVPGMAVSSIAEDCLTLNVWRPAHPSDEPRPVLVWIYGGAFVIGGSALATYDGARLCAEQDVVVVSVNYRLGALGFLDLRSVAGGETADANCGLRDLLLALRWVQRHIAHFGGDPARVTVFGESAGAGAIIHLLTTSGIEALVRSAIVQSPGVDFTQTAELAAVVALTFMERAGVETVDELRAMPSSRLIEIQEAVAGGLLFDVGTMVFHPVIDGEVVPSSPSVAIAAGAATDVALLIGYTTDEMRLFPDARADELDEAGMVSWVRSYLTSRMARDPGERAASELLQSYVTSMSGGSRARGSDLWAAIQTDGIMRQPVIRVADSRDGAAATYVYQFGWQARGTDRDLGAFHAIELPFVFDTFDVDGWDAFVGVNAGGRALGRAVRSAWAAFAASGDPSTAELGAWPRYDRGHRWTMVLDEHCAVVTDPLAAPRFWWADLWDPACRPAGVPR
jgi:para-nitrobenzyl esterase